MSFSVKMLKKMVDSGLTLQKTIGKDEKLEFKYTQPISVLHVRGEPYLSRHDRL